MPERCHSFLPHTADVRLFVDAESCEGLFIEAARGVTEFLFGPEVLEEKGHEIEHIDASGIDLESLFVDWLSKILSLSLTRYAACVTYDLASMTTTSFSCNVGMVKAKAIDDLKAITYSNLKINEANGRWSTTITFDI